MLKLATRIDKLLQRELGEGIAPSRMRDEPLYARDVLLVCEALPGSELQSLAGLFRKAAADSDRSAGPAREVIGIGSLLNSLFGPLSHLPADSSHGPAGLHDDAPAGATAPRRRWFSAPMRPTAADYLRRADSGKPGGP